MGGRKEILTILTTPYCCSKGDGERAMLEASNELRVVRDELENLMDIISTKVRYIITFEHGPPPKHLVV